MKTIPLEATARKQIDTILENLGWEFEGKNQNVYMEQARTTAEQKKLGGKRPDYVLYSKTDKGIKNPLIIIEAKKIGERLDTALEQGITYAKILNAPLVLATDGVFVKAFHTIGNTTPRLNGEDVDGLLRESVALKFLTDWEVNTISPKVQYSRRELIKTFDDANNMLRSDGIRAGIERFGEFANILFLKLISENEDIKKAAGIVSDFDGMCHWSYIKSLKENSRIEHINKIVYEKLNKLYKTEIFTTLNMRNSEILSEIMDKLDPLTLTDVESDVKGDAFEYFLKESTSAKNDLGEYFTPRHIVKTMVRLINPKIGEKIYDPFCGTGGFLIETFKHINNNMFLNDDNKLKLTQNTIFGNEITNTARITKMNMILAGDGHSNIHCTDSLANPVDQEYDVVITNMPYSQKTKYGNLYDLPSANGDSICVQHCIKAINGLSDNGRLALVVPEGFLFRKDLAKAREYLLDRCQLQSVISLPQGVFLPYTAVKTNIIYATKVNQKIKDKRKDYWYFNVKSDGYSLDNHRRKLETKSDLVKYEEYRRLDIDMDKERRLEMRSEMLKSGFELIPINKVRENSFILLGGRYREHKNMEVKYTKMTLGEIIDINCGVRITQKNNTGTLYPVYGGGGQSFFTDNFTHHNDYVISRFAMSKECVRYVKEKFYLLDSGFSFSVKDKYKNDICKEYIGKLLLNMQDKVFLCGRGQAQINIDFDLFNAIKIPVTSIDNQKNIVAELESYQRIIDGAKQIINTYKPYFYINPEWKVFELLEICDFEYGYTDVSFDNGDTRFVRITDINNDGVLSNDDVKYINLNDDNKKYLLSKDDLLVARIGATYGKTLLYTSDETAVFASYLIRLKLSEKVLPKYYFYFSQSEYYWEQAKSLVTGVGQPQFNANTLKLIKLPVPPLDEQMQIIRQIEVEKSLIEPSKQVVELFTQKIQDKINEILGGN